MTILGKIIDSLVGKLRAGLRSWVSTLFGIGLILVGAFGEGVNAESILAGIALIFARDGGVSSQQSGIRPEVQK